MSAFRLIPQAYASLRILIQQFPLFLRLSWLCMTVSLLGMAVIPRYPMAGGVVDFLARGVFVVVWMRLVALGEVPGGRYYFRLGRRDAKGGFLWMIADLFVGAPGQMVAVSLAIYVGLPLRDTALILIALCHLVLGGAYLVSAEAALDRSDRRGMREWRSPDLILRGGLALGVAAFVCRLPLELLLEGVRLLPEAEVVDGLTLQDCVEIPARYLGLALTGGTMALAWNHLSREEEGS